jgi:hypothetical protein
MLNLHAIVNPLISVVHPNENGFLYQSTGQDNVKGKVIPLYSDGIAIDMQVQTESPEVLAHVDKINQDEISRKFYLMAPQGQVPSGIIRPLTKSGDLILRADQTWWLVTAVLEDFSQSDWVAVRAVLQVKAPEWYTP